MKNETKLMFNENLNKDELKDLVKQLKVGTPLICEDLKQSSIQLTNILAQRNKLVMVISLTKESLQNEKNSEIQYELQKRHEEAKTLLEITDEKILSATSNIEFLFKKELLPELQKIKLIMNNHECEKEIKDDLEYVYQSVFNAAVAFQMATGVIIFPEIVAEPITSTSSTNNTDNTDKKKEKKTYSPAQIMQGNNQIM